MLPKKLGEDLQQFIIWTGIVGLVVLPIVVFLFISIVKKYFQPETARIIFGGTIVVITLIAIYLFCPRIVFYVALVAIGIIAFSLFGKSVPD